MSASAGNLVFTGVVDDPETLETLRSLGFRDPEAAAETIRGWHFGRRAAVRSPRAREVLTELTPALLEAFAGSGDADAALAAFDAALTRMPASVELLSILRSNGQLRELFGDVLGSAPRLAQVVATRPHVLDAAIDPARGVDFERSLDENGDARAGRSLHRPGARRRGRARPRPRLRRRGDVPHRRSTCSRAGSIPIAPAAPTARWRKGWWRRCWRGSSEAFASEHGRVSGGRIAVVALGKFGSREMTAASDLDLLLIYDFHDDAGESDGARPLGATLYYSRG